MAKGSVYPVYRHLVADAEHAGRQRAREDKRERLCSQRDRPCLPDGRLFGEVTPGPNPTLRTRDVDGAATRARAPQEVAP